MGVGLVLGGGGAVGHAFHAGVLSALAERTGFDPRRAEVIVGTSAGSIVGALLRAGVSADELRDGTVSGAFGADIRSRFEKARRRSAARSAEIPRRRAARLAFGSPGILTDVALRPWRIRPGAVAAALLPPGRVPTTLITDWLELVVDRWPDRALWITAVARNTGRRVVFGRSGPGAVSADPAPAEAVAASCAIPGVFAPVVIGGVEYVDGGVHSPTNADLAAGLGLDLVVVSSPMSAARPLRPGLDLPGRQLSRITLAGEVSAVRRSGTPVLAFQPTPADRTVMGLNAMDRSRREAVTAQARESTLRRLDRPDVKQRLAALLTG